MRAGHLEIFVTDVPRARHFYEQVLGLSLVRDDGGRFLWFDCGGLELLLRPGRTATSGAAYQGMPLALTLYTEGLESSRVELESRGLVFEGFDGTPGCPTFRDPDGNWFQLVDPSQH